MSISHINRPLALLIALIILNLTWSIPIAQARTAPAGLLIQPKGEISYRKSNKPAWKKVRANRLKPLFPGVTLKTGPDGKGRLLDQTTGLVRELGANTEIEVAENEFRIINGTLSEPLKENGTLFADLGNRFKKSQRYTTVRRSAGTGFKFSTAPKLTLSTAYPELAWDNPGAEYAYRLIVDGKAVAEIPAGAKENMIRYALSELSPGPHSYRVEALKNGEIFYAPKKDSALTWLSSEEEHALKASLTQARQQISDDGFTLGSLLEKRGLTVAAMDEYHRFFSNSPEEWEMRSILIATYHALRLRALKSDAALAYQKEAATE